MLTFEQAYEIAKGLKDGIDACDEYDNAYLFKRKADMYSFGGDGACVILKKNGKAINQVDFFDDYKPNHIRSFDLE